MPANRVVFIHKDLGLFLGIDSIDFPWFAKSNRLGLSMATTFDNVENARVFFFTRVQRVSFGDLRAVEVEPSVGMFATVLDLVKAGIPDDDMGDLLLNEKFLPGKH